MGSHALLLYVWAKCKLCNAFRNSPGPRCSVLELAFSTAEIRNVSKANGRLSATWNTSLLDLPLVYRAANHSSNCKTIIMKGTEVQCKPSAQFD